MNRMTGLPRPSPDPELRKTVLEAGFAAFPARKANYLRAQAAKRGEVLEYLPIQLDIENVSRCNYHCTMCQVSDWPHLQRARDMSLEEYKALLDSQHGLIEIKLQGMGEPLLGDCYVEMIAYARAKHLWVRSTTNGSLLHLREHYKRVIDADICEFQVSVDGATKATYENIRRGGRFERVLENCRLLNDYARLVNRRRTRMWAVVQHDNFDELEQFPSVAAEAGFDRLTFSLDLNDWGQDRWRALNDQVDVHRRVDVELAQRLIDLGARRGVEVTYWFIDHKYDVDDPSHLCQWPFERAYISSDMRVVPCCMIANPEIVDLGDARDLTSTWNQKKMAAFRALHLNGTIPKVCQSCYKQGASSAAKRPQAELEPSAAKSS
ncbi:MAG: radical SAM protein [Candidatus Omnitrophica bacterium]|nr:radical SAM protein [Candidatus Omnitrophota bacterium]